MKKLSDIEHKKIIVDWNKTEKSYPETKKVHELFEEQVKLTPNNCAVSYKNKKLTYQELNNRANQFANILCELKLGHEFFAVVCLERSLELVICFLGIMKAGGVYVPLDPALPKQRMDFILTDTKAPILIGDKSFINNFLDYKGVVFDICKLKYKHSKKEEKNININIQSSQLLYVMYTSGSTGKPKGVGNTHQGIVNRLVWTLSAYSINCEDALLQNASIGFDISIWEIMFPLLIGARLIVGDKNVNKDLEYLIKVIIKEKVSIIHLVPSLLNVFLDHIDSRKCKTIKQVICGGEGITVGLRKKFFEYFDAKLYHAYGPTEAAISVTHWDCKDDTYKDIVPIGHPIANMKCYVLDQELEPLPVGEKGELYIGGVGLARGYLNNVELTAEKFINNPFQTEMEKKENKNSRLYKTGDIVRWLPNGSLEFIGRYDFQVKIRGHRIELGEIEKTLLKFEGIEQCVVLAMGQMENQYLIGFYVTKDKLNSKLLLKHLLENLPEYMVPTKLLYVDKIPLTINGKLDRNLLIDQSFGMVHQDIRMPKNEMERKMRKIWSDILALPEHQIGINDSFFDLGGNSILAIKLTNQISKILKKNVQIFHVYDKSTIKKLANFLAQYNEKPIIISAEKKIKAEDFKLSFFQESLWFIDRYEKGTNLYNIPMVFKLLKSIDLNYLEKSLRFIISRHETLRTVIKEDENGNLHQKVLTKEKLSFYVKKIILNNEIDLDEALQENSENFFNLSVDLPIRVIIYEVFEEYYLHFVFHHIAFDGWSTAIFFNELLYYYNFLTKRNDEKLFHHSLPVLDIQYKDFSIWQKNYWSGSRLKKETAFWKKKLENFEILNLMTDKPRLSEKNNEGENLFFELTLELTKKLRDLSKECLVSLHCILLSAYCILLRIFSSQDDIVIGMPIANRNNQQLENLIGFFVNTLSVRIKINPELPIKEFIHYVNQEMVELQAHQDFPFEKLVDELKIPRDSSRNPVFQVMFSTQNFETEVLKENNIFSEFKNKQILNRTAKFDISTFVNDGGNKLTGTMNYSVSLYNRATIQTMIKTYIVILEQFSKLTSKDKKQEKKLVSNIHYLTKTDYKKIIFRWNETKKIYPVGKTANEIFEVQAKKTPDNIAVVFKERKITFKQLNEKANQLAFYFKRKYEIENNKKIEPDTLFALCLERSIEMIVGILAVLKTGAAYVPIDVDCPEERFKFVLSDTRSKIIFSHNQVLNKHLWLKRKSLVNWDEDQEEIANMPHSNLEKNSHSTSLAYVIYTSGSTGEPKGVMIEHNSLINYVFWVMENLQINKGIGSIMHSSIAFDLQVTAIYPTLFLGKAIYIAEQLDAAEGLKKILEKYKGFNFLKLTPSHLAYLNNSLDNKKIFGKVHSFILGGEALSSDLLMHWHDYDPETRFINHYGPTEATVGCCTYEYIPANQEAWRKTIPIGKPISNTQLYVLNANMCPVPHGVVGELYIGGVGIARGYLNRAMLTKERFVPNIFIADKRKHESHNLKLYKTGDLVKWLPDGNLEYIGRNDFQVKIRGFRVELGEIENALLCCPGIKQSLVLADIYKGSKQLVAYYISDKKLTNKEILSNLSEKLPEHMLPSVFVHLFEFPLTANGKLNRKALPKPIFNELNRYIAPKSKLEKEVCLIWSEVLGLDINSLSTRDDFFRLGGDSITSIQLVSKLRQRLKLEINIKDIFLYKTVERLCEFSLNNAKGNQKDIKTEQGFLTGYVSLLPIQKAFFSNNFNKLGHWNQSFLIKVPILDMERLKKSVQNLVEHHDAFRLRYHIQNGDVRQYYNSTAQPEEIKLLNISELSSRQIQETLTGWQSNFTLEKGPVYAIGYLSGYPDGSSRIFFALHHLIVDTISWRILTEDLKKLYEGESLGKKGTSYRQWVDKISLFSMRHQKEKQYWENLLAEQNDMFDKDNCQNNIINSAEFNLNYENTDKLIKSVSHVFRTEINDLLLTALAYALEELTQHSVNHIFLEGHGREEISDKIDIKRTLGWFTVKYPVRLEVENHIGNSLKSIKEHLRLIPNKGINYGFFSSSIQSKSPVINFNYLGQINHKDRLDDWEIVDEESGVAVAPENTEKVRLNILCLISNGNFKCKIKSKLSKKSTQFFSVRLKYHLERIISYLTQQNRSYLTISDVNYLLTKTCLDKLQSEKEVMNVYLANSLQQGFIYHALNYKNLDDSYRVQSIWEYYVSLDVEKFRCAWNYVQRRYPGLRVRFSWEEQVVQVIDNLGSFGWNYIDLTEKNIELQLDEIREIQKKDRDKPYMLEEGGLFRVYLIKQSEKLYTCLFSNHHSILDGWSRSILLNYLHETYISLVDNNFIEQDIDQAYELSQSYMQVENKENKEYWNSYISKIDTTNDLSGLLRKNKNYININQYSYILKPKEKIATLEEDFIHQLKILGQKNEVSLNSILLYVWHKILSIYGGVQQTMVGVTVSGRNIPIHGVENSVGLYINTLPIIFNHDESENLIDCIKTVHKNIIEINNHSVINLSSLKYNSERIFDNLFVYENYPKLKEKNKNKLCFNLKNVIEKIDYPLVVVVQEKRKFIEIKLIYASEIFDEKRIVDVLNLFQILLKQISTNINCSVKKLNYLDEKYYKKVVEKWNFHDNFFCEGKTIDMLFEEQAKKTPDNIAVLFKGKKLTYNELNEKSTKLAIYILKKYKIKVNDLIGLFLDRSEYLLIAILAVFKAGAAYVPIDTSYPIKRINYILKDTKANLILTNLKYKKIFSNQLSALSVEDFVFEDALNQTNKFDKRDDIILNNKKKKKELAYVIYTSGTTGEPKGVLQTHKNVIRLFEATKKSYGFFEKDVWTLFHSYVFDFSVWEIWGALIHGGLLIIPSHEQTRDFNLFYNLCNQERVTVLNLTPSAFYQFSDFFEGNNQLTSLRYVILGGEALNLIQLRKWFSNQRSQHIKIINMYGITETTVHVTYKEIKKNSLTSNSCIGSVISDLTGYVLDKYGIPLPIGAIGELYVGGSGLAKGYLNKPDLTSKHFLKNTFQTEMEKKENKNSRLYKTGDLVRWLPDRSLAFMGRADCQVKIRGFRIELGEIEEALSSFKDINRSVVLYEKKNDHQYLVAYYVAKKKIDDNIIREHLNELLPDYMIPNFFMHLNVFPLTINGKIDRKVLPVVNFISSDKKVVAPKTELEIKLIKIWSDILKISEKSFSIEDDFFQLGGNSLLAIKLTVKLSQEFNIILDVSSFLKNKTIKKIINFITAPKNENSIVLIDKLKSNTAVLSFSQERLWFIHQYEKSSNEYNIRFLLKLSNKISIEVLESSIRRIVDRHEILRTVIKENTNGVAYQKVLRKEKYILKTEKFNFNDNLSFLKKLKTLGNNIFDLSKECPIQVYFLELNQVNYSLIVIHHIAFDGWSAEIFLRELYFFCKNYNMQEINSINKLNLPEVYLQYKDFASWQKKYLNSESLDEKIGYWKVKLKNYSNLNLITDKKRPLKKCYEGKNFCFILEEKMSNNLREVAKTYGVTLYSVLLSAYYILLRVYSSQDDIVIGTFVSNRHYQRIENTIGFFSNTIVLRAHIDLNSLIKDFIFHVGKEVLDAQLHQDLPFERLVDELKVERDTSRNPIFNVTFDFQSFSSDETIKNNFFEILDQDNDLDNVAKFDISTSVDDGGAVLKVTINYAVSLFEESTIHEIAKTYRVILSQFSKLCDLEAKGISKTLGDVFYLDNKSCSKIISDNKRSNSFKRKSFSKTINNGKESIINAFERQVKNTPEKIAVVFNDKKITYHDLNVMVNQLAYYIIRNYNIKDNCPIALCLDRSDYMIVAILAILKTGSAYIPLDIDNSKHRNRYIIDETQAKIILTSSKNKNNFFESHIFLIIDEDNFFLKIKDMPKENISTINSKSSDLAYIIYTSGTTGQPKGVMIEHCGVVNLKYVLKERYCLRENEVILQFTNYSFDASVEQIFLSLLNGYTLLLFKNNAWLNIEKFHEYLNKNKVTHIDATPSFLEQYKLGHIPSLRRIVIGGEMPSSKCVNMLKKRHKVEIFNAYGVTEATITSTVNLVEDDPKVIGRPLTNIKCYVLDSRLNLMPVNAVGELYIGGIGIARGYINKPELTAINFIDNPFITPHEKNENYNLTLYKTGDLVRWRADGRLEYISRNDSQVKIRGYRIELREIENVLSTFTGIKNNTVILHETDQLQYLIGYYVSNKKINEKAVLDYLKKYLPEYMIPSALVCLENMPLTRGGKVDYNLLPKICLKFESTFVPPRNKTEFKLCEIWKELLGLEKIGIQDDFFKIGGNSLLAIQLVYKMNKFFSRSISLSEIFEKRNIEKISSILSSYSEAKGEELEF